MSTDSPDEWSAKRLEAHVRTVIASTPEGTRSIAVVRGVQPARGTKFAVYAALYRLHARREIRFGSDYRWRPGTAGSDASKKKSETSPPSRNRETMRRTRRIRAGWLWTDTSESGEAVQSAICNQLRTLEKRRYGRSVAVFVRTVSARDLLMDRFGEIVSVDISWRTFAETEGRWELAIIGIGLPGDQEPSTGAEARMQGQRLDEIERRTRTLVHCFGDRKSAEISPDRRLARLARLGTIPPRTRASETSLIESEAERAVYEGMKARISTHTPSGRSWAIGWTSPYSTGAGTISSPLISRSTGVTGIRTRKERSVHGTHGATAASRPRDGKFFVCGTTRSVTT